MTILEAPMRWFKCPSCALVDQSNEFTRMHPCPALNGMNVPLVEVRDPDDAPKARQVVVQREDGEGVASVRTERADGSNDCTVFARTATVTGDGHNP